MSKLGFRSYPRERKHYDISVRATLLDCPRIAFAMRWMFLCFFVTTALITFLSTARAQNVSIGTAAANNSALLHLESTNKGFLVPRMTDAQMWAISSPYTSDIVFNTTYNTFYYWNGTIWTPFIGQGWSITGDANTSASVNFLGTKDSVDLVQKSNVKEHMRVFAGGNVGLTNVNNVAEALIFYEPSGSGNLFTAFKAGVQTATVHYTLPPSDGTANQALVTDGAGNLSWHTFATFGGGGTDPLWARGSGTYAEYSLGTGNKGSGKYSIGGGDNNTMSGQNSTAWGDSNRTSAQSSTVAGGSNNSSSGGGANVRGGAWNNTSGSNGYVGGGLFNSVSGQNATIVNGDSNSVAGQEAVILNGDDNSTSSQDDLIFGHAAHPTGPNQLIFYTPGTAKMGMGTSAPSEAEDIVGNVKFSGALMPNNAAGTATNYLLSAGSGSPPTWGTITVPTTNWKLLGNSGTSPATNFIGTTDAVDFAIRTSNTERARITSTGLLGINISSPTHMVHSVYNGTSDETAAIFGRASGASAISEMVGVWGRVNGSGSGNTGTIAVLARGNGNTTAGNTNVALQISGGEFAMGRTTQNASKGTLGTAAASGTAYSQQGPSGTVVLSLGNDLATVAPTAGVYQDLGTLTINNQYISTSSIILVNVVEKDDGGGVPSPKNSIYRVDVESRASGSCVVRLGLMPFVTEANNYQGSDYIKIAYAVINPGR